MITKKVLIDAATATGAGTPFSVPYTAKRVFQAYLSSTTTPAGTVDVEVSTDGTNWIVLGTITLSGSADTDGFASDAPWPQVRGNVTAISGTGAAITMIMSV